MKYLGHGERILQRLFPRDVGSQREKRRLSRNLKMLYRWADDLERDHAHGLTDAAEHWGFLIEELQQCIEHAIGHLIEGDELPRPAAHVAWYSREARYYLNRMRVLACRGDEYSPQLTIDELAANLARDGIRVH